MPRRPVSILMLTIAGVIINIGVAWACALYSNIVPVDGVNLDPAAFIPMWEAWAEPEFEPGPAIVQRFDGRVWRQTRLERWRFNVIETRIGWPACSMRTVKVDDKFRVSLHKAGIAIKWDGEDRHLPSRPAWPGFAINTVFYAGVLWLLLAAPFLLRRRLRNKRGLCPNCAYPVGVREICTECGKPVRLCRVRHQASP